MRINSVTLRNCRLHRELKVELHPSRTLIGGPNETGKSTLVEAMHRVLFLRAKGNTEQHRALVSTVHPGYPEVEMEFEAEGNRYVLKKRFGSAGNTTLAPSNSVPLSGDAAEGELARLLGVEAATTGKTMAIQWAHVWVWQGQSGDDPATHATGQMNGLLRRLQEVGGAAALQSDRDAGVAKHFADAKDETYTQAGKAKAGSALEKAEREASLAGEQLAAATGRVRMLESTAGDLENASGDLVTAVASLERLTEQHDAMESKVRQLVELRLRETEQIHARTSAGARYAALASADGQIMALRSAIADSEASIKPGDEAVQQLEAAKDEAKSAAVSAEIVHSAVGESVRRARIRSDLAGAQLAFFERSETHAKLTDKQIKAATRRSEKGRLEEQLARLAKVEKSDLARLVKLETEFSNARATLRAMATGFLVVSADEPVSIAGKTSGVGEKHILTEDTDVMVGSSVRLRIQPGGGHSLADARKAESEAEMKLDEALDGFALQSVAEATEVQTVRADLGSRIKAVQAELDGMEAGDIDEELRQSDHELAATQANLLRLAALCPDWNAPVDRLAAKALIKAVSVELDSAEQKESDSRSVRDRTSGKYGVAESRLKESRNHVERLRSGLNGQNAQLDLLLRTHGDDVVRSRTLSELRDSGSASERALQTTSEAIAVLQPDLLEADRRRIARAIEERTIDRNDARTRIAVAQAALRSDGTEDPGAAMAAAVARANSATEHRNSVVRKAQAVALLDQLFQDEQRSLSERFTRPLADKISSYLQCIFGAGASAQVDLVDHAFMGLRLFRPGFGGAPFPFDTLSGGAREQTAAAVRLALAEVLAADFGGCLPVVFDDAFAYSDPERVAQVQRMLDLAASRGIQVIVLTCNPVDYGSLGARTVLMRPALFSHPDRRGLDRPPGGDPGDSPIGTDADPSSSVENPVAVTDSLRREFLEALSKFGGAKGNQSLREEIGWDESTYNAVKQDLIAGGKLVAGRGRGGSVAFKSSTATRGGDEQENL